MNQPMSVPKQFQVVPQDKFLVYPNVQNSLSRGVPTGFMTVDPKLTLRHLLFLK